MSSGATYSPQLLAGKTQAQIADALKDPSNPITKSVIASANIYAAAICKIIDNQPAKVCTSDAVTAAAAKRGKS